MIALVTGATGLVGNAVVKALLAGGHRVRALVRDPGRAARVLPGGVEAVRGDVTEPGSLAPAMQAAEWVFHAAGMPEQWQRDEAVFDRVNRHGTAHVLSAALAAGVKRAVYTSTMDVFAAPRGGTLTEERLDTSPKPTAYERSKVGAEQEAEAVRGRGLDVVYVNPAAVYGPGPVHVATNGFFIQLLNGKAPMLPPGGMSLAYIDGVARAHVAAAERGRTGERYLVADEHLSMRDLAAAILEHAAPGRRVPPTGPLWLLKTVAFASAPLARAFHFTPLVAPGQLSFVTWDAHVDAGKAARELGFVRTPARDGVARTVDFLRREGLVPQA